LAEADDAREGTVALQRRGDLRQPGVDAGVFVCVVFAPPPGPGVRLVVVGGGGGGGAEAGDVVRLEFEWRRGVDEGEVRE